MTKLTWLILMSLTLQQSNWNIDDKKVIIDGYDVVSYFEGKAEKGNSLFQTDLNGAIYFFVSQAHLEKFNENPEQFIPQYGGYCAYAMGANGDKVSVDPKTFKITDGKLYLFYNTFPNNTLKPWNKNESSLIQLADDNWHSKFLNND